MDLESHVTGVGDLVAVEHLGAGRHRDCVGGRAHAGHGPHRLVEGDRRVDDASVHHQTPLVEGAGISTGVVRHGELPSSTDVLTVEGLHERGVARIASRCTAGDRRQVAALVFDAGVQALVVHRDEVVVAAATIGRGGDAGAVNEGDRGRGVDVGQGEMRSPDQVCGASMKTSRSSMVRVSVMTCEAVSPLGSLSGIATAGESQ